MKKRRWWCSVGPMLERGERRRRAGRGAVEDGGLSLFIGVRAGGRGRQPVVKAKEWLALMGTKQLPLQWHFTPWNDEGGRENECGMQCGARDSASMAGRRRGGAGRRHKANGGGIPYFSAGRVTRGRVGYKAE
jgi:hypothetical protein